MDTISREGSSSPLPIAGLIAGALALVISIVGVVKANTAGKRLDDHDTKLTEVENLSQSVQKMGANIEGVKQDQKTLFNSVSGAVKQLDAANQDTAGRVSKLEDAAKKPAVAATKGGGPVVAGPNEYVVKPGDTSGAKIARDHNVSLPDLMAVNPGVNWSRLQAGQRIKLPVKGPAAK